MNVTAREKKFQSKETRALYIRNFIFGVEDSLVSTIGLLSGVAAAGAGRREILLTGAILIFVEAFSMGIGSLLSEHSAQEFVTNTETSLRGPLRAGLIMFSSYFIAGFIPLAPYLVFILSSAFWISITLTLISLFLLGAVSAKIFGINIFLHGFEMLILGGAAVAVGIIVGQMLAISL